MELGLRGKWALVCGSSTGLGFACALSLAKEGVNLVMVARTAQTLQESAKKIAAETGVSVLPVVADVSKPEDRLRAVSAAPQIDILINNAGGPKPADFRELSREDWLSAIDTNMLAPLDLIKLTIDPMIERGFGRIVNITSSAVKAPIDILGLSNGARSGLTGFIAGVSRTTQLASRNVTINNLLPGAFDTDRLRGTMKGAAEKQGKSIDQVAEVRKKTIPAQRFGTAEEFGDTCAFLCSQQASYITGQNVLIDGGAYPGTY